MKFLATKTRKRNTKVLCGPPLPLRLAVKKTSRSSSCFRAFVAIFGHMFTDLSDKHGAKAYHLLCGLVAPRPIAWVSTLNDDGSVNVAPFSYFTVMGSRPPMLAFAPGDKQPGIPKDTHRNLKRTGQFVVHLVDGPLLASMAATAEALPEGESELDLADLTTADFPVPVLADFITPRIAEAPVALACTHHSTVEAGMNRLVLGEIHALWTRPGLVDADTWRVDAASWSPVGRCESPDGYCIAEGRVRVPSGRAALE